MNYKLGRTIGAESIGGVVIIAVRINFNIDTSIKLCVMTVSVLWSVRTM